jgi:hypothetical protein
MIITVQGRGHLSNGTHAGACTRFAAQSWQLIGRCCSQHALRGMTSIPLGVSSQVCGCALPPVPGNAGWSGEGAGSLGRQARSYSVCVWAKGLIMKAMLFFFVEWAEMHHMISGLELRNVLVRLLFDFHISRKPGSWRVNATQPHGREENVLRLPRPRYLCSVEINRGRPG